MATKRGAEKLLSTLEVRAAAEGDHGDGGGLLLRVRGSSASWVFRYTSPTGRRREMGLGIALRSNAQQAGASLIAARDAAHQARELLRRGADPIDARDGQRSADREAEHAKKVEKTRQRWTLARAARDYHERVIEPSRTTKHAAQWIASLEHHVPPELWHAPVASIEAPALLAGLSTVRALADSSTTVPETLQRVRQRLDAVFEDAIFHKRCTTNPAAAIRRKMREAQPRRERGQFKALPYPEAPGFMVALRQAEGIAARCLEFAVLTAARTSEALLLEWSEVDLAAAVWTVPASKMKGNELHAVPLSPRALEILQGLRGLDRTFAFPSPKQGGRSLQVGKALSNMAMLTLLGRMGMRDRTTVHGLCRATFSTWANETGAARPDVIEACLAHQEADRVRASYNRASFALDRRALLEAWAEYLAAPAVDNVVPFERRTA